MSCTVAIFSPYKNSFVLEKSKYTITDYNTFFNNYVVEKIPDLKAINFGFERSDTFNGLL